MCKVYYQHDCMQFKPPHNRLMSFIETFVAVQHDIHFTILTQQFYAWIWEIFHLIPFCLNEGAAHRSKIRWEWSNEPISLCFGRSDVIKEALRLRLSPSWLFIKCDLHMCLLASKTLLVWGEVVVLRGVLTH